MSLSSSDTASVAAAALPIVQGRLLDFVDDPVVCMRRLQRAKGNLVALEEDGQRIVFVFGPHWTQQVLTDTKRFHSQFFAVRGPRNSAQRRTTSGLLSMNGEEHKQHRRMVMGPFQKKIIGSYHETVCDLTREMLSGWKVGEIRDINRDMTQFMLRVTSAILFGLDEPELAYRLGHQIDEWVHMNHQAGMGAFVSDSRCLASYDDLLALAETLESGIQEMIDRRRARGLGGDVLSLLIRGHAEEGIVADTQLIGHIALLFGAAHLTTAHTLAWTLFLLAQHPSIIRPLMRELEETIASDCPTLDEIALMPRMDRIIKESMRILPASGYSQRITAEPVELGPMRLTRGTPVIFSQFITHHLPELYDQPERFNPERWLRIGPSPYAYLPFGNGPRMCIGAPLAWQTLKTALPTILKRHRLTVVPDVEISGKIISTMLGPITPIPMLVAPQDGNFTSSPVTGNIHTMVELREVPSTMRRAA